MTTTTVIHKDAAKDSQAIAANIQKGKLFCANCGKIIGGLSDAVSFGGSTFHKECFTCNKCGKAVADSGFKERDGEIFCASCAGGAVGGGFCGNCGQKLSGAFVNAMGQKWHKDCFVCASCKGSLAGGYAEKDGAPYCGKCIQRATPTTTTTITGKKYAGFTVDPR